MAEEATRRLLKVFGIAVTEFEETAQEILARARATAAEGNGPEALLPLLAKLLRAESDLTSRWAEVGGFISETQARVHAELIRLMEQAQKR